MSVNYLYFPLMSRGALSNGLSSPHRWSCRWNLAATRLSPVVKGRTRPADGKGIPGSSRLLCADSGVSDTLQAGGLNSLDRWNRARCMPEAQREPLLADCRRTVASLVLPRAVLDSIDTELAKLEKEFATEDGTTGGMLWAVRSSASDEDAPDATFGHLSHCVGGVAQLDRSGDPRLLGLAVDGRCLHVSGTCAEAPSCSRHGGHPAATPRSARSRSRLLPAPNLWPGRPGHDQCRVRAGRTAGERCGEAGSIRRGDRERPGFPETDPSRHCREDEGQGCHAVGSYGSARA